MHIAARLIKFYANIAAFRGRTKADRREIRYRIHRKYRDYLFPESENELAVGPQSESIVFAKAQNILFPKEAEKATSLMIIVVPEHNEMSGGIFSMFSIAAQMQRMKAVHGREVLLMTRPNHTRLTYLRNTCFRNSENVFRFEQLLRCHAARDVYIHLPEYASEYFYEDLSVAESAFLNRLDQLHINLLNQNVLYMPEPDKFAGLYNLTSNITQSVAHHAYFTQKVADRLGLPTLFQPAYTDLSNYPGSKFSEKENLIIYSPDEAPYKEACLSRIRERLPEYKLVQIQNITFDHFMELATRCRFAITFGEGFDGYLAQPIHQGGISFALFNEEFFPSPHFRNYYNIFTSEERMVDEICERIRVLESNQEKYEALNKAFCAEYEKLYSYDEYVEQIRKLCLKEFELFPSDGRQAVLTRPETETESGKDSGRARALG